MFRMYGTPSTSPASDFFFGGSAPSVASAAPRPAFSDSLGLGSGNSERTRQVTEAISTGPRWGTTPSTLPKSLRR
eukprot:7225362-Prymnesium_polylepis.1